MGLQDLTQVSKPLGKGSILGPRSEETSALGLRRVAQRPGTAVRPERLLDVSRYLWASVFSSVNLCLQDHQGSVKRKYELDLKHSPKQRCCSARFLGKLLASSFSAPPLPKHPPRPNGSRKPLDSQQIFLPISQFCRFRANGKMLAQCERQKMFRFIALRIWSVSWAWLIQFPPSFRAFC